MIFVPSILLNSTPLNTNLVFVIFVKKATIVPKAGFDNISIITNGYKNKGLKVRPDVISV